MEINSAPHIPSEVRAAIGAFLNGCQKEARPLATVEALGAVRRMFPDLAISNAALTNAISREALIAGFQIAALSDDAFVIDATTDKPPRTEAQRRMDTDTDGTRRRTKAIKDRNELI